MRSYLRLKKNGTFFYVLFATFVIFLIFLFFPSPLLPPVPLLPPSYKPLALTIGINHCNMLNNKFKLFIILIVSLKVKTFWLFNSFTVNK